MKVVVPRLSLRAKLLLGILLVLLPVLGVLLAGYQAEYSRRREGVLDALAQTAQAVAVPVDDAFENAIAVATALAQDPEIRSLNSGLVQQYLRELSGFYPQYDNISIWDANGDLVGSITPPVGPTNIADRPYFQRLMATGQPQVSELVVGRILGRPIVVVLVPIGEVGEPPRGTANVVIDLESWLGDRLESVGLQPGQVISVIDPTGRIAYFSAKPELPWEERDVSHLPEVQAAMAGQRVRTADFRGPLLPGVRVAAFVRSPKHGWVVGVEWPISDAFGPLEQAFRQELLLFGAIALLSILGTALLAAYLVRPVQKLVAYTRLLGRGDLTQRVQIGTGDELEELGQAFNSMAESLQRTLQEREAARKEAERERDFVRAILDNAPIAIAVMQGPDYRYVLANPANTAISGVPPEKLLGRTFSEVFPEAARILLPVLDRVYRTGRTEVVPEFEERLPDGRTVFLHLTYAPLPGPEDRPVGVVRLGVDITEQVKSRRRIEDLVRDLARTNAHLRAVLDGVESAILLVDASGQVVLANRQVADFFGLAPEHLTGKKDMEVAAALAPLFREPERYLERVQWLHEHPAQVVRDELEQVRPMRRTLVRYSAPVYHDSTLLGRVVVFHDVTREREAARLKDEFMFLVSHELRTPLTVALGGTELALRWLRRQSTVAPTVLRQLESVREAADRERAMVEQLLDVSTMAAGRLTLRRQKVYIQDLIQEELAAQAEALAQHRVVTQIPPDFPPLEVDPVRIRQVIGNLLSNAAKYSPPGTTITVRLERRDGEAVVSVTDQGPGIPPEEIPRLFSLFHRIRRPIGPWTEGLGLGLYISKGLVEAHGGRVWVESHVSKGSTFYFSLPISTPEREKAGGEGPRARAEASPAPERPASSPRGSGRE